MAGVVITILVKNNAVKTNQATIYYKDIGDYLKRTEKFEILKKYNSIVRFEGNILSPNGKGDWINQRNELFSTFIQMETEKKFNNQSQSFFALNSIWIQVKDNVFYNLSSKEDQWKIILEKKTIVFNKDNLRLTTYRPFFKQLIYQDSQPPPPKAVVF